MCRRFQGEPGCGGQPGEGTRGHGGRWPAGSLRGGSCAPATDLFLEMHSRWDCAGSSPYALVNPNRTLCAATEIRLCLFVGKSKVCECVCASVCAQACVGNEARVTQLTVKKKPMTIFKNPFPIRPRALPSPALRSWLSRPTGAASAKAPARGRSWGAQASAPPAPGPPQWPTRRGPGLFPVPSVQLVVLQLGRQVSQRDALGGATAEVSLRTHLETGKLRPGE